MKDGVLSFIPPDGEFKLMEYQVAKPTGMIRPIALPLKLTAKMSVRPGGGKYLRHMGTFICDTNTT
jgi:hypothetical protein